MGRAEGREGLAQHIGGVPRGAARPPPPPRRGVERVDVTAGANPSVAYTVDGREQRVACRLVVGDAAGYNDPVIGEGLSIALRDVRMLSELLAASDDWSPAALQPYVEERAER